MDRDLLRWTGRLVTSGSARFPWAWAPQMKPAVPGSSACRWRSGLASPRNGRRPDGASDGARSRPVSTTAPTSCHRQGRGHFLEATGFRHRLSPVSAKADVKNRKPPWAPDFSSTPAPSDNPQCAPARVEENAAFVDDAAAEKQRTGERGEAEPHVLRMRHHGMTMADVFPFASVTMVPARATSI